MARQRLPPLLSILLAFAATTVPHASAFGAGAPPPPPLGAAHTTRHHDRDPSHSATSSRGGVGRAGGGGGTVPAPTEGGRAAANRRDVLRCVATGCLASLATATTAAIAPANADVLRSPGPCANGEGGGCDALSDDNEYIKSLQSKSRDNREANQRVRGMRKPLNRNYDDDGNLVRFDFGWVGWAAVAVILSDLRTSYLGGCSVCIEETKKTSSSTDNAANKRRE